MIDMKQAVKIAEAFFAEVVENASYIQLEEVDTSEDQRHWLLTLSALVPVPPPTQTPQSALKMSLSDMFRTDRVRVFKVISIDAETGDIKSMKIRNV